MPPGIRKIDNPRAPLAGAISRFATERAEPLVLLSTIGMVVASWTVLAAFIAEQYNDVFHDARGAAINAQQVLASHIDTTYEQAETLLGVANSWLAAQPEGRGRPPLTALGATLERLTRSDPDAIVIVAIDQDRHEIPTFGNAAATVHPTPSEDAGRYLIDLTASKRQSGALLGANPIHDGTIRVGAMRTDTYVAGPVLPLAVAAHPNAYGIAFLQALVPVRRTDSPFGALMPGMPSRVGIMRHDGQILLAWPSEGNNAGAYASELVAAIADAPGGRADFLEVSAFPGLGPAYVSYAAMQVAPIGVFAAFDTGFIRDEVRLRIAVPCVVTAIGTLVIFAGGFLVTRLIRYLKQETANTRLALNAAEKGNESKRQFLANMSHELRTPLNAVIGFAEIMAKQILGPIGNAQYAAFSGDILNSGRHLLEMLQAILDMARFEGGHVALGNDPVDLGTVTAAVTRLLQDAIRGREIDVRVQLPPDCPVLCINPMHLRQVLTNILGNAVKFSHPNGVVTVTAEATPDRALLMRIADNGVGIPQAAMDSLFRPFAQVEAVYSRKHGGIGLGLAISKSIVEAYGGSIALDSAIDFGTTVTIRFPVDRVIWPSAADAA